MNVAYYNKNTWAHSSSHPSAELQPNACLFRAHSTQRDKQALDVMYEEMTRRNIFCKCYENACGSQLFSSAQLHATSLTANKVQ